MTNAKPATKLPPILKALIEKQGLSVNELGRSTGIPYTTIIHILNGTSSNPSTNTLATLAIYFHVSTDYLLGLKSEESEKKTPILDKTGKTALVPVLPWHDIKKWIVQHKDALKKSHNEWISSEKSLSSSAFAVKIENSSFKPAFSKNSTLLVDPRKTYAEDDYVIASINKNLPTPRVIAIDGGQLYLNALSVHILSEKLALPHVIYGKVVECRTGYETG